MKPETSDSEDTAQAGGTTVEDVRNEVATEFNWNDDPANPYNWPRWKKNIQLTATAAVAFSG